jgi:hypothetical protein
MGLDVVVWGRLMILSEHIRNRNRFPQEELRKYANQHVAWSLDGTRILGGNTDPLRLVAALKAAGYDSSQYVLSFVDAADSSSAVWIDGDEEGDSW